MREGRLAAGNFRPSVLTYFTAELIKSIMETWVWKLINQINLFLFL